MSTKAVRDKALSAIKDNVTSATSTITEKAKHPTNWKMLLRIFAGIMVLVAVGMALLMPDKQGLSQINYGILFGIIFAMSAFRVAYYFLKVGSHTKKYESQDAKELYALTVSKNRFKALVPFLFFLLLLTACSTITRYKDIEIYFPVEWYVLFGAYLCFEMSALVMVANERKDHMQKK